MLLLLLLRRGPAGRRGPGLQQVGPRARLGRGGRRRAELPRQLVRARLPLLALAAQRGCLGLQIANQLLLITHHLARLVKLGLALATGRGRLRRARLRGVALRRLLATPLPHRVEGRLGGGGRAGATGAVRRAGAGAAGEAWGVGSRHLQHVGE